MEDKIIQTTVIPLENVFQILKEHFGFDDRTECFYKLKEKNFGPKNETKTTLTAIEFRTTLNS